jgi:hypothetical protein
VGRGLQRASGAGLMVIHTSQSPRGVTNSSSGHHVEIWAEMMGNTGCLYVIQYQYNTNTIENYAIQYNNNTRAIQGSNTILYQIPISKDK